MAKLAGHSVFLVLFVTVFLDFLGFAMVLPYLYFYAESMGATPLVYGLLLTSYSVAQLAFTPIWDALSDRLGRRKIMLRALPARERLLSSLGLQTTLGSALSCKDSGRRNVRCNPRGDGVCGRHFIF